jgi:hypothetical protein
MAYPAYGVAGKAWKLPSVCGEQYTKMLQGPPPQGGTHGCTVLASLAGPSITVPGAAGRAEVRRPRQAGTARETRVSRGNTSQGGNVSVDA